MTGLHEDPRRRRVVLPLSAGDRLVIASDAASRQLLRDPAVAIVELPLSKADAAGLAGVLERNRQLEPRALLVQSEYEDDQYFAVSEAPERIARAKLFHVIQVCRLLGATEVAIEDVRRVDRDASQHWSADGRRSKVVGASVERRQSEIEAFVDSLSLYQRFPGSDADFDAASNYLARTGLSRDDHLRSLVNLRGGSNPLIEQGVEINTRAESERLRKWIAKCKIPLGKLNIELESVERRVVDYRLSFRVSFGGRPVGNSGGTARDRDSCEGRLP